MLLFFSGKVATKWKMIGRFQSDNILIIVTMVSLGSLVIQESLCLEISANIKQLMAVGHCVAVAVQVQSGLGQPRKALNSHHFKHYEQVSDYAINPQD